MLRIYLYFRKYFLKTVILACISLITILIFFCLIPNIRRETGALEEDFSVKVPIIMYHGLVLEEKHENRFFINAKLFKSDLDYLKENGFNTIFTKDLIDFVYNDVPLPEKPIMITFDDGYLNNFIYGFPLLKEYNVKMVFSPIGKFIDDYSKIEDRNTWYAHATWNDIKEMTDSGLVEIQNHSYNMHSTKKRKGCRKIKNESIANYKNKFESDVLKFQEKIKEHCGQTPEAFVYPFGAICRESEEILKSLGFKATFSCEGKMNTITKQPDSLYHLCRFIRPDKIPSKEYFEKRIK
jgi:peptidoglycan/xylan/chitin deacetylase (PgdA/CDA1 family)